MSLRTRIEDLPVSRPLWAVGGVILLLVAIALLDMFTGLFHLTMLYVIPIVIATYIFGIAAGFATASGALIEIAIVHADRPTALMDFATDFAMFLFVIIVIEGMRVQLQTIRALQARRDLELGIARQVQHSTASPVPADDRFDTACVLEFAREVGGDYFRFDRIGDTLLTFVGDIAGKSVAAALFSVMLNQAIEDSLDGYEGPLQVAETLNRRMIAALPSNMFVTMIIAALDDRSVTYVNCGHVRPLFFEASSGSVFELEGGGTIPLGVQDVLEPDQSTRAFGPGDVILICSDGVTESRAFAQSPESLEAAFSAAVDAGPEAIVHGITDMAKSQGQTDDITVIAIRRR